MIDVSTSLRIAVWQLTFLARITALALALPIAKRRVPFARLVKSLAPRRPTRARDAHRMAVTQRMCSGLYGTWSPFPYNCVEQSLILYRYLALYGGDVVLVAGVRRGALDVGHAWVTLDGAPVNDDSAASKDFVPVMAFGAEGMSLDLTTVVA